jgi:hypothetical protein
MVAAKLTVIDSNEQGRYEGDMKRRYRIKEGVRPYPGKVLVTEGAPDDRQRVWGHVRIDGRRMSGLKGYYLHELTPEQGTLSL